MRNWKGCLYWSLPVMCVVTQLVAATIDYATWNEYLASQILVIGIACCAVLPFLCAGILTSWLFAVGLKFDKRMQISLVWNSIKAKLVHFGALIGWIGIVSALGPILPPSEDYSAGIISLACLVMLPPVLALTYEYQGCKTLLSEAPRKSIVAYIAASSAVALFLGIILVLVILLALFLDIFVRAIIQNT